MPIYRISEDVLVGRVHIEHDDAVALATVVAECTSITELFGYLSARIATKFLRVLHQRRLVRTARNERNPALSINRLPL